MSQYQRKYPRHQCTWTCAENALLVRLLKDKTPMHLIEEQLGRSRRSVNAQLRRLGYGVQQVIAQPDPRITTQDRAWMDYWRLPRDQRSRLRETFGDHPTFSPDNG